MVADDRERNPEGIPVRRRGRVIRDGEVQDRSAGALPSRDECSQILSLDLPHLGLPIRREGHGRKRAQQTAPMRPGRTAVPDSVRLTGQRGP